VGSQDGVIEAVERAFQVVDGIGTGPAFSEQLDVLLVFRFHKHQLADIVQKSRSKQVIDRECEVCTQVTTEGTYYGGMFDYLCCNGTLAIE
jgi:hypothetical protein